MKKLISLIAILMLATPTFAEDVVVSPEITEVVATDVVAPAVVDPIVAPVEPATPAPAEELGNAWVGLGFELLVLIIGAVASAIAGLVLFAVKKIAKKYNFEISETTDLLIKNFVIRGIEHAEKWAKVQAEKPRGSDKKVEAIRKALELAASNETVKKYAAKYTVDILNAKVEELLRSDETPAEVTPKS